MTEMRELVLYHANCNDGFCAAWLFNRSGLAPAAEYIPVQYGEDPPDVRGARVWIFDFSYPRDVLEHMHGEAATLRVFDHHKTAEAEIGDLAYCTFDMNKSGARLAAEYLGAGDNWLVDYTEDRDLWRWKLPQSEEISAALNLYPREFGRWDSVFFSGPSALAEKGEVVLIYERQCIEQAKAAAGWVTLDGRYRIPCVNMPVATLISRTAGELAEENPTAPFAACFFVTNKGEVVYSLRSRGDFDVSEVAKKHGGGGHRNAAGFRVPYVFHISPHEIVPREGSGAQPRRAGRVW